MLREFIAQLIDTGGWGISHAATLEVNLKPLDELDAYPDPTVVEFVASRKISSSREHRHRTTT